MEEVKKQGMESLFVPYEIALQLKELRFDEEQCLGWYESFYSSGTPHLQTEWSEEYLDFDILVPAPLYQQAFRFFREKYGCCGYTNIHKNIVGKYFLNSFSKYDRILGVYDTWEEAQLECLKEMIKVVKNK
jgi:hypothetical protein